MHTLELPAILGDNMVLQRQMPVPIWGKAKPDAKVTVTFAQQTLSTTADRVGNWRVNLAAMPACEVEQTLTVTADSPQEQIVLNNVLVGEVWHGSGQSNMAMELVQAIGGEKAVEESNLPGLRVFTMTSTYSVEPQFKGDGQWQQSAPETVRKFSNAGFFFARHLREALGVPVGIFITARGAATAETFVPRALLEIDAQTRPFVEMFDRNLRLHLKQNLPDSREPFSVQGQQQPVPCQAGVTFNDAQWPKIEMPGYFETHAVGPKEGFVWLRKTVALPSNMQGKKLTLTLGKLQVQSSVYVNEHHLEEMAATPEKQADLLQVYEVPFRATQRDNLTIAINLRVDAWGGGMARCENAPRLSLEQDPSESIDLSGSWQWNVLHPFVGDGSVVPENDPRKTQFGPAVLYNGIVHPAAPMAHRGVIWYQGETNTNTAVTYANLMKKIVTSWRTLWDQQGEARDFPFIQVQLANYREPAKYPGMHSGWADIREAQHQATRENDNVYLVTAVDTGETNGIHPRRKWEVGTRLAGVALARVYLQTDVVDQGPTFTRSEIAADGRSLILHFDHAAGLTTKNAQPLAGFAIRSLQSAAEWCWADAQIQDENVTINLNGVTLPAELRYAWAANPTDGEHGANLLNGHGLPAFPFKLFCRI